MNAAAFVAHLDAQPPTRAQLAQQKLDEETDEQLAARTCQCKNVYKSVRGLNVHLRTGGCKYSKKNTRPLPAPVPVRQIPTWITNPEPAPVVPAPVAPVIDAEQLFIPKIDAAVGIVAPPPPANAHIEKTVDEMVKKAFEDFRAANNFDDLIAKMNAKTVAITKSYAEVAKTEPAPLPPSPPESVSERRGNVALDFIFKRLGVSNSCDFWWILKDCYLNFPERFEIGNTQHISGDDNLPHINIIYKLPTWKKTICYQSYHLYTEPQPDGTVVYRTFTTIGLNKTPQIIAVFRY